MSKNVKLLDLTEYIANAGKPAEAKKGGAKKRAKRAPSFADSVGITTAAPPEVVVRLATSTGLRHIVQKDSIAYDREVETSGIMLLEPRKFLEKPLEVILGPKGEETRHSFLDVKEASTKKTQTLAAFGDFVSGLPGSRTIWDQALLIADELYTNGSKNAWDPGPGVFTGPPVRTGTIEFFAEAVGDRLIIGCRDSFGKLDVDLAVSRIATCYENGVAQSIRHGTGGAGIGTYMVFDSCISYYAGVDVGSCTVVCVALPLGLSRRQATGLSKNIHLLSIKAKEVAA